MSLRDEIIAKNFALEARDVVNMAAGMSLNRYKIVSRQIGIGTIMDVLGPDAGAALLDTLSIMGQEVPAIRWALVLISAGNLDVGMESVRNQIDKLVLGNILTADQAKKIKDLALEPDVITPEQIFHEMYNPDWSLK